MTTDSEYWDRLERADIAAYERPRRATAQAYADIELHRDPEAWLAAARKRRQRSKKWPTTPTTGRTR